MKRFWDKVAKGDSHDCWEWLGYKTKSGYGCFWLYGKSQRAHRIAWLLTYNVLDKNHQVLHKCDNPSCVNPNHLFLGDHNDNMADMKTKQRANGGGPLGTRNGSSKLTEENVKKMRHMRERGVSYRRIANEFHVSVGTAHNAITGKNWKQV